MSTFIKAMRFVGDLDDRFYADEFQRDVWNEASAIGLQLFLWSSLIAAAVLPWAAGTPGAWVAVGLLVAAAIISGVVSSYARARRVDATAELSWLDRRFGVFTLVYLVAIAGVVFHILNPVDSTLAAGLITGAIGGFAAAAYAATRAKRARAAEAMHDEL